MSQNFSLRRALGVRWTDTWAQDAKGEPFCTREWHWLGIPLGRTRRAQGRSTMDDGPFPLYSGRSADLDDLEAVLGLTIGTLLLGCLVGLGGRWVLSWGVHVPAEPARGVHTLAPPRGHGR